MGSQGRFVPIFFAIQGLALLLNDQPQVAYWILAVLVALTNMYLSYRLTCEFGNSPGLGVSAGFFFFFTPYTISTYWSTMHVESFQVSFVLAFIICSLIYICRSGSWIYCLAAVMFYGLAIFLKESSVFLLAASLIWCGITIFRRSAMMRSIPLALGALVVTTGWWFCRWHYISLAKPGSYGQRLFDPQLLAYAKRLLIYITEIVVVSPTLLIMIPFIIWCFAVELRRKGNKLSEDSSLYRAGFLLAPLFSWLVGLSFISQIEVRYLLPVIALGIILSAASLSSVNPRLRKMCGAIMLVAALNNFAGTVTARKAQIEWARSEEKMVRHVAELPQGSTVFCATTYPSSGRRLAQRIQWSTQKWFLRKDVSVKALNGHAELPSSFYLLLTGERWASEWCNVGWHPGQEPSGEIPKEFNLRSMELEKAIGFKFWGWQVRGWHLLVLCERLLKRDGRPDPPLGLMLYEANFDFYQREGADFSLKKWKSLKLENEG
jgi:hypothetical protein